MSIEPQALADLLFADRGAALLLIDTANRVRRANETALDAFGVACLPGAAVADVFPLIDRPAIRALLTRAREAPAAPTRIGAFLVSAESLLVGQRFAGLLLRAVDLARLRQFDPEQAQAGKLQALGLLAGGIAHDFNNLLTAVLGAAEAALERAAAAKHAAAGHADAKHADAKHADAGRADPMIEDLRTIQDGATRGQDLVRQRLAFGRQQTLQPRIVAANQVVADLARLLGRLLGARIQLELMLEEPGRHLRIDPGQLDRVLVNLSVNARNAMPDGGTLTLRTGHATLVRPLPTSAAPGADTIPPGRYVTFSLADTGCGIPPDRLPHLFDPFYTTRRREGGTGLGLASVHGIVRQSNGYVGVASTVGVGTCFTLYLPRHIGEPAPAPKLAPEPATKLAPELSATKLAARAPAAVPAPRHAAASRTVLLVEDEAPVRRLAVRALRQHGYDVIDHETAEDALGAMAAEAEWDRVAVVVSDVMLPGLDGPGLLRELRCRRPGLPAILTSGYADAAQRTALEAEHIQFLAKPYSLKLLADSVAGALAALEA